MSIENVSTEAAFKQALQHDELLVVDFFATWCGPCKMIHPMVEKFAAQYPKAKFIEVDVDVLGLVAQEYEVSSMPTFLLFKEGKVIQKIIGANPAALKQALVDHAPLA